MLKKYGQITVVSMMRNQGSEGKIEEGGRD